MSVSRGTTTGAIFFLFTFISIIMWAFYDYVSTPQPKVMPVLLFFVIFMYIFTHDFGEWIPKIKPPLFLTEGGLIGVYLWHESSVGGMVTYYFSTRTKYADHAGFTDFSEKNAIMRFFTFLSNVRICYITDYANKFDEVSYAQSDVPERCIIYRGTLRKDTMILTSLARLQKVLDMQNAYISQIITQVEKAKTIAEYAAQQQNKDMVEVGIQLGNVLDNVHKPPMMMQPPQ